jgi:hypothetical protein
MLGGPRETGQDAALRGLLSYSLTKLKRLQRDLDRILAWRPGGFLWGGRPRPQPDPLVGLGLVPNPSRTGASGARLRRHLSCASR